MGRLGDSICLIHSVKLKPLGRFPSLLNCVFRSVEGSVLRVDLFEKYPGTESHFQCFGIILPSCLIPLL